MITHVGARWPIAPHGESVGLLGDSCRSIYTAPGPQNRVAVRVNPASVAWIVRFFFVPPSAHTYRDRAWRAPYNRGWGQDHIQQSYAACIRAALCG